MAQKLSLEQLKDLVGDVVTKANISNSSFSVTRDNVVGLVDKIGKIVILDTVYAVDKLNFMDGEYMEFGKTIEEWQQDLILPRAYDSTGANALAPNDPSYRPAFYSYSIGKKVIPTTIRNNNIERAVHNGAELVSIVAMQTKRLQDSMAAYRYQVKREMLAKFIDLCHDEQDASTVYAASTAYSVGTVLKKASADTTRGIVVKAITSTSYASYNTWALNVTNGYIIELNLVTAIAIPTTTETGEAFITQVKKDIEVASDLSEGHSLNGNTLGAVEGLKLIVKQGVIPSLEVDTYAGAFNRGDLAIPATIEVVKDFGEDSHKAYAILMDARAARLHNTYRALREQINADGDFLNLFDHTEDTAWISRNAFIKVYEAPSE